MASAVDSKASVPTYDKMLWPTLQALMQMGGSGTVQEIMDTVVEIERYSEAQQSVLHGAGPSTEISYRLHWARTYLGKVGALENSQRGVWAITDYGRTLSEASTATIPAKVRAMPSQKKVVIAEPANQTEDGTSLPNTDTAEDDPEKLTNPYPQDWRVQLLELLMNMPPGKFENLCQRVLRESGFTSVRVIGKSGDGGIDGIGVLRIALISFQVLFQCKRYQTNVGAGEVRDFRGAMEGRADKGLLITTGGFTPSAQKEASRDGAKVIDLIDGDQLCALLKELKLGVSTRQVEEVAIDPEWFSDI